jgi:predicted Fe-S protein YdhL (DUF1289 family)
VIASPCTGVCAIEEASGLCRGCRRTIDEIIAWPAASDAEKRRILDALPSRAAPIHTSSASPDS